MKKTAKRVFLISGAILIITAAYLAYFAGEFRTGYMQNMKTAWNYGALYMEKFEEAKKDGTSFYAREMILYITNYGMARSKAVEYLEKYDVHSTKDNPVLEAWASRIIASSRSGLNITDPWNAKTDIEQLLLLTCVPGNHNRVFNPWMETVPHISVVALVTLVAMATMFASAWFIIFFNRWATAEDTNKKGRTWDIG